MKKIENTKAPINHESMPVLNNMLAEVICYLYKHKVTFNDNGCDVCDRCGKHEYYDNDFHNGKPILKTIQFFNWEFCKIKRWYKRVILKELPF